MILRIGINEKGINGNVDEYVHYKKYSIKEMKEMEVNTKRFINNKIKEGDQVELYFYDEDIVLSNKKFTLNIMLFDSLELRYIKYKVK